MSKVSSFRPLLLCTVIAGLMTGCGESTSSTAGDGFGDKNPTNPTPPTNPNDDFNQTALLANLADNVIAPAYQKFEQLSQAQQQAIHDYCQLENNFQTNDARQPIDDALATAQTSWRNSMSQWQHAEVMQIGPLTTNSATLRNTIYSWPTVSSCGVDQDVMFFEQGTVNSTPYDITKRTATRRGLDVLEYLLFTPTTEHSCNSTKDILASWPDKTEHERRVLRCNFAVEVATDLNNNATTIVEQWSGNNGYAAVLKQAGQADNKYATAHDGVNAISDAMFYLDKITKDLKLGTPLGLTSNDCGGVGSVCPESVESPYSDHSIENMISNLKAFRALFNGEGSDPANTIGFDDYLIDIDDTATAEKMLNDTNAAIAALESYQVSLAQSLNDDPSKAEQSHQDVKDVTDQLKVDFINSLALKLPKTAAGDND
ncbi:peptidase M75 [Alteromonadales bacterium alter-6D02]|nr:peptidase M75 [Alteromonadales bacterium alter-6D02]